MQLQLPRKPLEGTVEEDHPSVCLITQRFSCTSQMLLVIYSQSGYALIKPLRAS